MSQDGPHYVTSKSKHSKMTLKVEKNVVLSKSVGILAFDSNGDPLSCMKKRDLLCINGDAEKDKGRRTPILPRETKRIALPYNLLRYTVGAGWIRDPKTRSSLSLPLFE